MQALQLILKKNSIPKADWMRIRLNDAVESLISIENFLENKIDT
jgi:hypothetical protein